MKQGLYLLVLAAALAVATTTPAARAAKSTTPTPDGSKSTASTPAPKSRNTVRQFTGYVTALDRSSLTVEKRGKSPRSMVFTKDAGTQTSGTLDKEARVTVYYREADGRVVAQRVVAKPVSSRTSKPKSSTP